MTQVRNVLQKWHSGSTVFILTSLKTEIAKYACEPRWQGLLAEDALAKQHLLQKSSVICKQQITKFSVRTVNLETITDTQSWYKPWKTKTSQKTEKSLRKFLEPSEKPKVIYTDNSLEFGKPCEDLSWNHRTSTPYRSETNGIAERAARRVKEGTSAVLLQSGLDEKWWADSMECCCYLRHVQDLLCENSSWKAMRRNIVKSNNSWNIIRFLHETSPGSTILARKCYLE